MYEPMKNLKEFHDKFLRDRDLGVVGDGKISETVDKRKRLIQEETAEVSEALDDYWKWTFYSNNGYTVQDTVDRIRQHLAKELADLLYVVYGTAEEFNISIEEVFKRVHESNMSKVWDDGTVHYNEFGKVLKPPTYSPPDLSDLI